MNTASSTMNEELFNHDVIEAAIYHPDPHEQRSTGERIAVPITLGKDE